MVSVLPFLAALIVFLLVIYLGYIVILRREERAKRRSLALVKGYASSNVHEAIAEAKRQDSLLRVTFLALGMRLTTEGQRKRLRRHVLYTGTNDPAALENILVRKATFLLGGLVAGVLIGLALGGMWWWAVPGLTIVGFLLPDVLIYNQGVKRDEEITKKLPDALDMLNLCVESGLSFQAAMTQVANNQTGPVAAEFAIALQEMQLGRARGQALESIAARTRQEDILRFVSAMMLVDKIGVPVSTVLREQSREMRSKRFARAREKAQKVPVKILMPLMVCLLPALFIIILGPAAYSMYLVFTEQL